MNTELRGRTNYGKTVLGELTAELSRTPIPPTIIHGTQPALTGGGAGSPELIGTGGLGYSSYAFGPVRVDPANTERGPR